MGLSFGVQLTIAPLRGSSFRVDSFVLFSSLWRSDRQQAKSKELHDQDDHQYGDGDHRCYEQKQQQRETEHERAAAASSADGVELIALEQREVLHVRFVRGIEDIARKRNSAEDRVDH